MDNNGWFIEKQTDGSEVIRYDTKRKYTKEELAKQRQQFMSDAKSGKVLCLSDLMINSGM